MLTETEKKILDLLKERHLITKEEVNRILGMQGNGASISFSRLIQMGYVEKVESLGTCFVITQDGIRALKGD